MLFKLSPSSLNLMEECPRCFWLEKHNIWKRPTTPFPSLPNGIDLILKKHFDRFREKGVLPPEISNHPYCKNTRLFDNEKLLKTWQNNLKGISWEDNQGNILFGVIDNLLMKEDKLIVIDYKTRSSAPRLETLKYHQLQLDIYNLLLRKNKYNTEDFSFLLFYIPKEILPTGEFIFEVILKRVNVNPTNAERVFEKAILLLNSPCPKKGCEWCKRV